MPFSPSLLADMHAAMDRSAVEMAVRARADWFGHQRRYRRRLADAVTAGCETFEHYLAGFCPPKPSDIRNVNVVRRYLAWLAARSQRKAA